MKINPFYRFLTKEQVLHSACVNWFRVQYRNVLFTHIPNEGKKTNFERWLYNIMGVKTGMPDLLIFARCKGYAGLAIELKCGKNGSTKLQKECQAELRDAGWLVLECYDEVGNFIKIVNDYLRA